MMLSPLITTTTCRENDIPLICVCDTDKQTVRSVVDFYLENDDYDDYASYLFDEQVIAFSTQGREHSHMLIVEAIKRAVKAAFKRKTVPQPAVEMPQPKTDRVHEAEDGSDTPDAKAELAAKLLSKFGTAERAFSSFAKDGIIDKKGWRRIIKKTIPSLTTIELKALRKKLPKKLNLAQFSEFIGERQEQEDPAIESHSEASGLADLTGVPLLPPAFKVGVCL